MPAVKGNHNRAWLIALLCCFYISLSAESDVDTYYSSIDGLHDSVLKSTLSHIINNETVRVVAWGKGKNHTWHFFYHADRDTTSSAVLDMYSNIIRFFDDHDPTNSIAGCDIEHTFPNSWWGGKSGNKTAYCDLHLLVPADYSANRSKSNIPPGFVQIPHFDNGVFTDGSPKNSRNLTYPQGLKKVFEVADDYKGDFARMYFYTATRYETVHWITDKPTVDAYFAMTNESYLEFQPWLIMVLLQWHRADPVSQKERLRQEKVYEWQLNRNPFVDYPTLVEYIWGNHKGQTFRLKKNGK